MPLHPGRHRGKPLTQHVHNFALAFVAPLGAEHYRCLRSHVVGFLLDARECDPETDRKQAMTLIALFIGCNLYDDKPLAAVDKARWATDTTTTRNSTRKQLKAVSELPICSPQ